MNRPVATLVAVRASAKTVLRLANRVLNRSKALTPVDTGNLRASQRLKLTIQRRRVVARVYTRVKYAASVHEGARAHDIVPRRKKALKFKIGGQTVIVSKVHHPGNKARPFMRKATLQVAGRYRWLRVVSEGS